MSRPVPAPRGRDRELVLVGGGHAHAQVLLSLARRPLPRTRTTLVSDRPYSTYSGMIPACVAGLKEPFETSIDLVELAERVGARLVLARVEGLDPERRRVHLRDQPDLRYDVCSLNVGSTVLGQGTPGVQEHAIPTRPIGDLIRRLSEREQELADRAEPARVVVVGGGCAGVELAFAVERRLDRLGFSPRVTLLDRSRRGLAGFGPGADRLLRAEADERNIRVWPGCEVVAAEEGRVHLADGAALPCDFLLWATGAAPHSFLGDLGLTLDRAGFVKVTSTLQSVDHPEVFGAGDCVGLVSAPGLPKAGVYAVREGPILEENLRRFLAGDGLVEYRPQRGFLSLLSLGDGRAVLAWKGLALRSRWAMSLKNWLDASFLARFCPEPA